MDEKGDPSDRGGRKSNGIPERRTVLPPRKQADAPTTPRTALPPKREPSPGSLPSRSDQRREGRAEANQSRPKRGAGIFVLILVIVGVAISGFLYLKSSGEGVNGSVDVGLPKVEGPQRRDSVKIENRREEVKNSDEAQSLKSAGGAPSGLRGEASPDFGPDVIFEGNSLTANKGGIAGGGSSWPTKLMNFPDWGKLTHENFAEGGNLQTLDVEPRISVELAKLKPAGTSPKLFFIWSGINDITRNVSSAKITDSLRKSILEAKRSGFYVVIIPLTPVAKNSDGLRYGYNSTQQKTLEAVNRWIATEGASLADRFLDLNQITELRDPTNPVYYVDGLHQTDAGREKIAQFVAQKVRAPKASQ